MITCNVCKGSGTDSKPVEPGMESTPCPSCGGNGKVEGETPTEENVEAPQN